MYKQVVRPGCVCRHTRSPLPFIQGLAAGYAEYETPVLQLAHAFDAYQMLCHLGAHSGELSNAGCCGIQSSEGSPYSLWLDGGSMRHTCSIFPIDSKGLV